MERRFFLFIVVACLVLVTHAVIVEVVLPPPPKPKPQAQADAGQQAPAERPEAPDGEAANQKPLGPDNTGVKPANEPGTPGEPPTADAEPASAKAAAKPKHPHQAIGLGSYAPDSPFNLHLILNTQGGSLECVELTERDSRGALRYRELDEPHGYLGYLALAGVAGGCQVNVVGAGTPAALARCQTPEIAPGLLPGDVIQSLQAGGAAVEVDIIRLPQLLAATKPGDKIVLTVARANGGATQSLKFDVTLDTKPLEIIHPESAGLTTWNAVGPRDPLSCLLALAPSGSLAEETPELVALERELRESDWEVQLVPGSSPAVEFHYTVETPSPNEGAARGLVEIVKRYRIHPRTAETLAGKTYHIDFELEFHNRGAALQRLAYRLDGPNGLPVEGWWYMTKIHPKTFESAGARDIVCKTEGEGRRLFGLPGMYDRGRKKKEFETVLFADDEPAASRELHYLGVDTQYFLAALLPVGDDPDAPQLFRRATAKLLSDPEKVDKKRLRTANGSFECFSLPFNVEPGQAHRQKFEIFVGPKQKQLLEAYGLDETIAYGWFAWVVKPLSKLLHFLHSIVGNWGIAIILLTAVVRGCMFPLSRKAAVNAAMMQQLAPEMKAIADKYKTDMQKRGIAQRELFRKYNYNPLSGCWMVFLQLPIFVGLYRCLAIDVDLRQAALIPGIEWASNLAGPDKLFLWKPFMPGFLADETGWLGPFFNFLPCITIGLFLLQQKMFTPPATDEQTRMQMTMMKYMTLFMGVMFYKVPAGLCTYFIMSSLWSIAERKLVPKPKVELVAAKEVPGKPHKESFIEKVLRMAEETNRAQERSRKNKRD